MQQNSEIDILNYNGVMIKEKKVAIYCDGVIYMIRPQEILIIQALGAYSTITLVSGRCLRVSKNMKTVMSFFKEAKYLVKVHRSSCINIAYVHNVYYTKNRKLMALLTGEREVQVSLINMTQLLSISK